MMKSMREETSKGDKLAGLLAATTKRGRWRLWDDWNQRYVIFKANDWC
jgi:hypothetical protein